MMRSCLFGLGLGLLASCDGKSDDDPEDDSGSAAPAPAVGVDADEDGYVADTDGGDDCDDADPTVHPGATETWYDGVDTDCDGSSDYDADADGYDAADHGGDDCDDADPATYPGAVETWDDGIDQDCDGTVDRASSACVAEFTFRTPSGEATIDGCQEWSLNAAFEFDPDDVPEVRAFQLSFDGSTEAEFECSVSLVQDHVCGTAYYRQGDTEAGRTEVVTLDCTGVADEDETIAPRTLAALGTPPRRCPATKHRLDVRPPQRCERLWHGGLLRPRLADLLKERGESASGLLAHLQVEAVERASVL